MEMVERIRLREVKIGVIGCGYVGLPLAVEFAKGGFSVVGIDTDREKVDRINKGDSFISDVDSRELKEMVDKGRLSASGDFSVLKRIDAVSICVPTPLRKTRDPDVSFIVAAMEKAVRHLHPGQLIVLESTTYPGTTEELVLPMLERPRFKVGRDFFLAFSPERVDPGNPVYHTKNTPKVVGGVTEACTRVASALYREVIDTVVPVSSPRVAEMVKLLENTFRSVNIGMVNELALMCHKMGIDVWEVIDAAGTKPFGFMSFYPGPGIGGHCIPIDPFYLSWKAKQSGFEPRFIELAGQINSSMPGFVVSRVADALNRERKSLNGSKVLILGVAYKRDVNDLRESPALDVMELLHQKGAQLSYHDPYIPSLSLGKLELRSKPIDRGRLKAYDCVVILTDHRVFDYPRIVSESKLIVDTRNALKGIRQKKIFRF
jgi:UDP-N-acetyl-D-glucosamine dehydrogenase